MAKINIAGVRKGNNNFTVHIVLTELQTVNSEELEVPIGEAFLAIPHNLEIADIKDRIIDAAKGIIDAHKDAQDKRKDIEELDFPEIQ